MSRIFCSSDSRYLESVPSSPAETMYRGHLSNSEIPSAVRVLPVPGGPCRTAERKRKLVTSHAKIRTRDILTDETLALALDYIVDALGSVVFVRLYEGLHARG